MYGNSKQKNGTVISPTRMKAAKKRLGTGRNQVDAIKKPGGELTYNKNKILVVKDFYIDLYNR